MTSSLGSAIWIERLHNQSSIILSVTEPKLHALYSMYNTSGAFSIRCQIHIAPGIIPVETVYLLRKHSSRNWTYISIQFLGTAVPPMCYHCVILGNLYNIFSETVSVKKNPNSDAAQYWASFIPQQKQTTICRSALFVTFHSFRYKRQLFRGFSVKIVSVLLCLVIFIWPALNSFTTLTLGLGGHLHARSIW